MYFRADERIIYRYDHRETGKKKDRKKNKQNSAETRIEWKYRCNDGGNGIVNMFIVGQPSKMKMAGLLNRTVVPHNPMNISYNSWRARCFIRVS